MEEREESDENIERERKNHGREGRSNPSTREGEMANKLVKVKPSETKSQKRAIEI